MARGKQQVVVGTFERLSSIDEHSCQASRALDVEVDPMTGGFNSDRAEPCNSIVFLVRYDREGKLTADGRRRIGLMWAAPIIQGRAEQPFEDNLRLQRQLKGETNRPVVTKARQSFVESAEVDVISIPLNGTACPSLDALSEQW